MCIGLMMESCSPTVLIQKNSGYHIMMNANRAIKWFPPVVNFILARGK